MRRIRDYEWNAGIVVATVAICVLTGCPSDPNDLRPNSGDDDDDVGIVDDADVIDEDDAPGDPDCLVPSEKTLSEALESGCEAIEIDGDLSLEDVDSPDGPLVISDSLVVYADDGDIRTIEAPLRGLFDVVEAAELTLRNLVFRGDEVDRIDEPVIAVTNRASLSTENVTFEKFQERGAPVLRLDGARDVELVATKIHENISDGSGGAVIDCIDSNLNILDGSSVDNNDTTITTEVEDGDIDFRGSAIRLQYCPLVLDKSQVSANSIAVEIADFYGDDIDHEIALRGAGVYAEDSNITATNSRITENFIDLKVANEGTFVELEILVAGAGIDTTDGTLLLDGSTVSGNGIDVGYGGAFGTTHSQEGYGAGLAVDVVDADVQTRIESSTVASNHIAVAGDPSRRIDGRGAGLAFSSLNGAQLQIANSTVGGNIISRTHNAVGAGVSVAGPGTERDTGSLVPVDLSDIIGSDDESLVAVIRHSTIASNSIEESVLDDSLGVGLHVFISDAGNADSDALSGPFLSLIGLLLNDNMNDDELVDCSGMMSLVSMSDDGDSTVDNNGVDWSSGHNWISATSVGTEQYNCFKAIGESEIVEAGDAELENIQDLLSDEQPMVYVPGGSSPVIDAGGDGPCHGITTDQELEVDQVGQTRPVGGGCDIGSVEVQ